MRKTGDNRPDNIVKKEIFDSNIKNNYYIEFVLDDRNKVVKMWRELGLTCLQVADGNF
jgi:adenylate cyclase class IV